MKYEKKLYLTVNHADTDICNDIVRNLEVIDMVEVDSLSGQDFITYIIPLSAILAPVIAPAVSEIINKILESKKVKIKVKHQSKEFEIETSNNKSTHDIIEYLRQIDLI